MKIIDNFKIANEMADLLVEKNIFESVYFKTYDFHRFQKFIKETVIFVALQICDLLIKVTVSIKENENVSLLMRNLTLTREGTIDLKKTIHLILSSEQLPPSHSCELACYYFCVDEIFDNHFEMIVNKDVDYFAGHGKEQAVKRCLDFWKYLLKSGIENFKIRLENLEEIKTDPMTSILRSDDELRKVIIIMFEEAVKCNNEIAVHYLWKTFFSKIDKRIIILRKIMRNLKKNASHININMFLFFNIKRCELNKTLKYKCFHILMNIVRNVRWHFIFALTFNNFKMHLDTDYSLKLLLVLTRKYFIDFSSLIYIARQYIILHSNDLKNFLSNNISDLYKLALTKPFIYAKKDLVNSLLSLGNDLTLKKFLSSYLGIDLIAEAMKKGNLEFVDDFLLERIMKGDIIQIKIRLYDLRRNILYKYFIENRQFQKIIKLIDWLSEARPESLDDFKYRWLSRHDGLYVRQMIFMPNSESDVSMNFC